jgi:hypothetical protein
MKIDFLRRRMSALAAVLILSIGTALAAEPASKPKSKPKPVVKQLLECKIGPYEKQTRFAMQTANGKPVYIAYWSSNGPYRCSFESSPNDGRTRWLDSSVGIVVSMLKGTLLIEDDNTHFTITAREVDRMSYCGTFGTISGVLTVPKAKNNLDCTWEEKTSEEAGHLN